MNAPRQPNSRDDQPKATPPSRRRPRYSGTHPRRFEERYKELQPQSYPEMQAHIRAKGGTPAGTHVPVLVNEVLECLDPKPGETVADCTIGHGGHAIEFIKRIGPAGRLIGFDVDAEQLERTRTRLANARSAAISLHHSNFAGIAKVLRAERLDGYDILFADLGVSSMQVDDPARGFSYRYDGPLDMRMDRRIRKTTAGLLASMTVEELSAALRDLADEPHHGQIAAAIVRRRAQHPLTRTRQLVNLIFEVNGTSRREWQRHAAPGELHPAARTFQTLRILVNDELAALAQLLRDAPYCLRPGGRIGIITFQSGEDRLVKKALREGLRAGTYSAIAEEIIRPTAKERHDNPRSASAKFRWARKAATS
jgi:16S rRNA (cytosine1402-N4)-methyltransferase